MKIQRRLLNLSVALFLISGWVPYLPASADTSVAHEEARIVSASLPPHSQDDDELRAALDALDIARQQGPEAVLALGQTLRGKALDLAMDDIVEAHRQLAQQAPPRLDAPLISEAEELAALQAQATLDAVSRVQAFAQQAAPLEEQLLDNSMPAPEAFNAPNAPNAPAADLTVGSSPCTYSNIATALNAANDGDRLLLEGGAVFTTHLNIHNSVTIQGGYDGCGSASSAPTTLDAEGSGRTIVIYNNLTVTLENLNITNGSTTAYGAGVYVQSNSHLIGDNINIYGNTTPSHGGGLFLYGAQATLTNTEIFSNVADTGAGVYGIFYNGYAPALNLSSSTDIHHNTALTNDGFGGGVYMSEGEVELSGCSDIYSNSAIEGGGAYLISSMLTIQGACSEIADNTATGNGGGIYAQFGTIYLDEDAEVLSNSAGTDGTGSGGGAYLDNSFLTSEKSQIYYNTAGDSGGGVYATNQSRFDMDLGGYPCTGPRCSQLSYNTATNAYGGGVYVTESEVNLHQIFVEGNTALLGGGIYAWQNPASGYAVYTDNTLLAHNDGGGADGIQLFADSGQTTSMTGDYITLAYNPSDGTGTAIGTSGSGTLVLALTDSIVWGHTTSIDDPAQSVSYSDVQGGYTGTGNLDVDPLFVDEASADFHLQRNSPVIDRCNNVGEAVDFDNQTRPWTVIRPATPYDMGADEVGPRVGINGNACAYNTIQDAVDAAASGDTLRATAETFSETVSFYGKNLTIAGGYDIDCATYITDATTTVDATGLGMVFDVLTSTMTLRNLNLTGGDAPNGAGLRVQLNSHVILDNTDVFSNYAANTGGGLYINAGNVVTLTNDSDIYDNVAGTRGGGARVFGKLVGIDWKSHIQDNLAPYGAGVAVESGVLELRGSHVTGNEATAATGCGGGVHLKNATLIVSDSSNIRSNEAYDGAGICAIASSVNLLAGQIFSNMATNNGGGLYLSGSALEVTGNSNIGFPYYISRGNEAGIGGGVYAVSSTLEIEGNIYSNRAITQAGGMFAESSVVTLTNAHVGGTDAYEANEVITGAFGAGLVFSDTQALLSNTIVASNTFSSGVGWGGGILLNNSTATLTNSQVLSNTAGIAGGGIAMMLTSTLNILGDSLVAYNTAGNGGGIAATDVSAVYIANATLQHNTATGNGGAIYVEDSTLEINYTYLRRNSAQYGGAIYQIGDVASGDVVNSLIYSNTVTSSSGAGIHCAAGDFTVTHVTLANNLGGAGFSGVASGVFNSIAWGNGGPGFASPPVSTTCNIDEGGQAGLNVDPLFVAPGAGEDYHLLGGSPAIDACAVGVTPDLDNITRPFGRGYDMGVYEFWEDEDSFIFLPLVLRQ